MIRKKNLILDFLKEIQTLNAIMTLNVIIRKNLYFGLI